MDAGAQGAPADADAQTTVEEHATLPCGYARDSVSDAEILPILLAELALPALHPEGPGPCLVQGFVIRDGDATILVDTGVGEGSALIERLYAPKRRPLEHALAEAGVAIGDVSAVVCSHLHFDHCGGNRLFPGVPIWVQAAELAASREPHYTVPEWVDERGLRYERARGERALSARVRLVPTAGHTPGHQSVAVATPEGLALIVAQAAYSAREFESAAHGHAGDSGEALTHLHALHPRRAYFSHDDTIWTSEAET